MKFRLKLILIEILYLITHKQMIAEADDARLTPFHPISQGQYDAILDQTSGQSIITEARLIASGNAALKDIAAGVKLDFSSNWLSTIFSSFIAATTPNATADDFNLQVGYPLCVVVKNSANENKDNANTIDGHGHEGTMHDVDNNLENSIAKCVLVIKKDHDDEATVPAKHHYNINYAPAATSQPPASSPPPPYPYSYSSYGNYYANATQYSNDYGYDQQHKHQDYVANYRHYPSHHDVTYQKYNYKFKNGYKTKSHKLARIQNHKQTPVPINYNDNTTPSISTIRSRKVKRDEYSTSMQKQNNNYAKITNLPASGYQPSTYPQISYHSQYPKVAYSTSYNYPSPVYVGTTPRSQRVKL